MIFKVCHLYQECDQEQRNRGGSCVTEAKGNEVVAAEEVGSAGWAREKETGGAGKCVGRLRMNTAKCLVWDLVTPRGLLARHPGRC